MDEHDSRDPEELLDVASNASSSQVESGESLEQREGEQLEQHQQEQQGDEVESRFQSETIPEVATSLPQFYKNGSSISENSAPDEPQTPTRASSNNRPQDTPTLKISPNVLGEGSDIFNDSDTGEISKNSGISPSNQDDQDSLPSRQHSRQSSIQSMGRSPGLSPSPAAIPSTPSSIRSPGAFHSIDQRFRTRLSSLSAMNRSPSTPTKLNQHLRSASQLSNIDDLADIGTSSPWDPIRWTKLRKLSNQLYSDSAATNYGRPTSVLPSANIAVGTEKGFVLIFDYHQNLKHILGASKSGNNNNVNDTLEYGEVTALAASADFTFIGVGYSKGHITTWDLNRPSSPSLHIAPISNDFVGQPKKDGHLIGSAVVHLGFSGKRHSAFVSADIRGMVFSHSASRSLIGRSVNTRKVLGRYPQNSMTSKRKPTSILASSLCPLGTEVQPVDDLGLVAVMTPYMLAIISTNPRPQTEYKINKPKTVNASMGLSACMAWFPALKGSDNSSVPRLAYCWSNVLTILEAHSSRNSVTESVSMTFVPVKKYVGFESIVSIQWISRQIIALTTCTQRLMILNESTMVVSEQVDLINKHVMHHDYFSKPLHNLTITSQQDEEQDQQPLVVSDAFFNTIKSFKGRLFFVGQYEFVVGSLSNWADRLLDIMEVGDYVKAIKLATSYYVGGDDLATIGLPSNDKERHDIVEKNLPDMLFASLKYIFREDKSQLAESMLQELTDSCLAAVFAMEKVEELLGDIFEYFENSHKEKVFFEALVPFIYDNEITVLPPNVFKSLVLLYAESPELSDKLEELICSLDTKTLDLDLTLSLCKQYHLLDTKIYIWNHALQDFITPMQEFMALIDEANESTDFNKRELLVEDLEKLFPYLSYILTGRVYPTGFFMQDQALAFKARSEIYYFLFGGSSSPNFQESYEALSRIISFNCSGFFAALNEAFEDSFLNDTETELPQPLVERSESSDAITFGISMNRQFIINALLDLFAGRDFAPDICMFLNIFIARNYPKYSQFLILPGHVLSRVLEELCYNDDIMLKEDCELAIQSLLSKYNPPDLEYLINLLYEVKLYRVLQFVFRTEKRYTKILEVTLKLFHQEKSVLNDFKLMNVLQECLQNCESKKEKLAIEEQIISNFETFVTLDSERFVQTVSRWCPHLHEQIFKLDQRPDLQYYYLKKLFQMVKKDGAMKLPSIMARNLYVSLLIKRGETDSVRNLLTTVLTGTDIDLPNIVDELIEIRAIDILALLLQRRDRQPEAMIYIVDHLLYLDSAYETTSTPDEIESDLKKYVYMGIELCDNAEDRVQKSTNEGKEASELSDSLGEQVWARLIDTLVDIARPKEDAADFKRKEEFRRQLLQQALSALLESTGHFVSNIQHNSTIIRIFKSVLSPQAAKSRTIGNVRPILSDLFSAYRYQYTMLSVARQLLDHETYDSLLELVSVRLEGWKVARSGECEGCGHKIIGVGVDAEWLYDSWQKWQKRAIDQHQAKTVDSSMSLKARGKRPITAEYQEIEGRGHDTNMLVVFKCGHTYHLGCLRNLGSNSKDLKCIVCD